MCDLDYTFTLDDIGERLKESQLHFIDHEANQKCDVQVAIKDDQLSLVNDQALPPLLADLVDIAATVHFADRLAKYKRGLPRRILIRLPLRQYEILDQPDIHRKLQDILYWFTEDSWRFEFRPYAKYGRSAQIKAPLPFYQNAGSSTRVALWSGGLDSFAGVYQQLIQDDTTHYTLFGTGSNNQVLFRQKQTVVPIETFFPKRTKLVQLHYHLEDSGSKVKKSASLRSRGFVFMLLGAVCAYQERQSTLYIYENGIGAINLPFRKSEVGLDHSRSVHPLSLHYMSDLVSCMLEQKFLFENPFLFWTKAQMCRDLLLTDAAKAVFSTVSCDSMHRRSPMIHCGYCSSCLLRRQAISAYGVIDKTRYQITEESSRQRQQGDGVHYYAMLAQVNTMRKLLSADNPWQEMSQHYRGLADIAENVGECQKVTQEKLLHLYENYVHEWDSVKHIIGPEFPQ